MTDTEENIMNDKLTWLIKIANKIMPHYQTRTDTLLKLIARELKNNNLAFAHNCMASDKNIFMIISTEPKQTIINIINAIKHENSPEYQSTLNPTKSIVKLAEREFVVDMNGTKMLYVINASVSSNYLLKVIACKYFMSVNNYADIIKHGINKYINELHPHFDYSEHSLRIIYGGKKGKVIKQQKNKSNPRIEALGSIMQLVRNNDELSKNILFVNDINECNSTAMNIIYTDYKYKNAIVEHMKSLFENHNQYKFKAFMHNDFYIPYDFKLTKHSCLINDSVTSQAIYIANLYNMASYTPILCYKHKFDKNINITHPAIKLQLLYIDMYMIEHKTKKIAPSNQTNNYVSKMITTFNEVESFNDDVEWIGYYIDDAYSRNNYNLMSRTNNAPDMFYI